jgi:hypothetical protein
MNLLIGARMRYSPQERASWRTIAPQYFERQADQLVFARFDFGQVDPFDDPDFRAEENSMRLEAVASESAHRKVIDTDGSNAAI